MLMGFLAGVFVGAVFGVLFMALVQAGRIDKMEEDRHEHEETDDGSH